MKIAIGIEYDGSRFHGWQSQPSGNTVQDQLERASKGAVGAADVAEQIPAGVEAEFMAHRPVDNDKRRGEMRGGLYAMRVEAFVGGRSHQRNQDPHHTRYTAGHHRVRRDLLYCRFAVAWRNTRNHFLRLVSGGVEHFRDALPGGGNYRKCVFENAETVLVLILVIRQFDFGRRRASRAI